MPHYSITANGYNFDFDADHDLSDDEIRGVTQTSLHRFNAIGSSIRMNGAANADPNGDPSVTGEQVQGPPSTSLNSNQGGGMGSIPGLAAAQRFTAGLGGGGANWRFNGSQYVPSNTPQAPSPPLALRSPTLTDDDFQGMPYDREHYYQSLNSGVGTILGRDGKSQYNTYQAVNTMGRKSGLGQGAGSFTRSQSDVEQDQERQIAREESRRANTNFLGRSINAMKAGMPQTAAAAFGYGMMGQGIKRIYTGVGDAADVVNNHQLSSVLSNATTKEGAALTPGERDDIMSMYGQKALMAVGNGGMAASLFGGGALATSLIHAGFDGGWLLDGTQAASQLADPTIDGDTKKELLKSQALNIAMMVAMGRGGDVLGNHLSPEGLQALKERFSPSNDPQGAYKDWLTNGELRTRNEIQQHLEQNPQSVYDFLDHAPQSFRDQIAERWRSGDEQGASQDVLDWAHSHNIVSHVYSGGNSMSIPAIRDAYFSGHDLSADHMTDLQSQVPQEVHDAVNAHLLSGDVHGAETAFNDWAYNHSSDVPHGDEVGQHLQARADAQEHLNLKNAFLGDNLSDAQHQQLFDRMPQSVRDTLNLHLQSGDSEAALRTMSDWAHSHFAEPAKPGSVILSPDHARMVSDAVTGGFRPATPEEMKAAYDASRSKATLSDHSLEDLAGMHPYKMNSGEVYYALHPLDAHPMTGEKAVDITSVMNNAGGKAPGVAVPGVIRHAIERWHQMGGESKVGPLTLDAWDVRGFLPKIYGRHGFEEYAREPYDVSYGEPSDELKNAWKANGWKDGDPLPDVVYMRHNGSRDYNGKIDGGTIRGRDGGGEKVGTPESGGTDGPVGIGEGELLRDDGAHPRGKGDDRLHQSGAGRQSSDVRDPHGPRVTTHQRAVEELLGYSDDELRSLGIDPQSFRDQAASYVKGDGDATAHVPTSDDDPEHPADAPPRPKAESRSSDPQERTDAAAGKAPKSSLSYEKQGDLYGKIDAAKEGMKDAYQRGDKQSATKSRNELIQAVKELYGLRKPEEINQAVSKIVLGEADVQKGLLLDTAERFARGPLSPRERESIEADQRNVEAKNNFADSVESMEERAVDTLSREARTKGGQAEMEKIDRNINDDELRNCPWFSKVKMYGGNR